MIGAPWNPGRFLVAANNGVRRCAGHVAGGIGLTMALAGSPKGRRPPTWSLYHLGSGHHLVSFPATEAAAFETADAALALGDWSFTGLDGWRNSDPDLRDRFVAWRASLPGHIAGGGERFPDAARQIAMASS